MATRPWSTYAGTVFGAQRVGTVTPTSRRAREEYLVFGKPQLLDAEIDAEAGAARRDAVIGQPVKRISSRAFSRGGS
jgi:hypothetical protein